MNRSPHSVLRLGEFADAGQVNPLIFSAYRQLRDDARTRRSHLLGGRYENIYIARERLPVLAPVLEQALALAAAHLKSSPADLRIGFWFNEMQPGHRTLMHNHDDDDELLSGVYYVTVPPNSGNLLLHTSHQTLQVRPRAGLYALFAPNVDHEVTENLATETRLSIGMNFGPREPEEYA